MISIRIINENGLTSHLLGRRSTRPCPPWAEKVGVYFWPWACFRIGRRAPLVGRRLWPGRKAAAARRRRKWNSLRPASKASAKHLGRVCSGINFNNGGGVYSPPISISAHKGKPGEFQRIKANWCNFRAYRHNVFYELMVVLKVQLFKISPIFQNFSAYMHLIFPIERGNAW